jgi:hypothetical protein
MLFRISTMQEHIKLTMFIQTGCLVEKNEAYLLNKKLDRMMVLTFANKT